MLGTRLSKRAGAAPAAMPTADSTKQVIGAQPSRDPKTHAAPSTRMIFWSFGVDAT